MSMRPWFLGMACASAACTGMSLGENEPGGDTWVEPTPTAPGEHRMGAVAVEPDEDQLWVVHEENLDGVRRAHLTAIDPITGATHEVMDVSAARDRRVVFPSTDRMILLAETDAHDNLVLFDTTTRRPVRSRAAPTLYWGTRTSPSGRALVVADNVDPLAPLHVIDTATLGYQVLEHGGDLVEAMWNHQEDILIALSVTDPFGDAPVARLLRYDLRGADLATALPAPSTLWELPGYGWDALFSFTWIGISPDDHWAVFPLIKHTVGEDDGQHVLLVLDQTTGAVSLVPGSGPVGFTRDGRSIVSYGVRDDGGQDLWLIDPVTHETTVVTMPFTAPLSFTVSRETDAIVCNPVPWRSDPPPLPLVVYDVAADTLRTIDAPPIDLGSFVTRRGTDEIWLASGGAVTVLSLDAATLTPLPLDGARISDLNVRPSDDQAVAADREDATIRRLDMATRRVEGAVIRLPSPHDVAAAATLSRRRERAARELEVRVESAFDPQYRTAPAVRAGAVSDSG